MAEEGKTNEALEAEVEALRRRVAKLEARDRERDRTEAELRGSLDLLQLILDGIPRVLYWKGRDFRYLGANRRALAATEIASLSDVVGKDDFAMPWASAAEHLRAEDLRVLETGETIDGEVSHRRPDGTEIWVRRHKTPVRDRSGQVIAILALIEDITAQKRSDEEREHARVQEEIIRRQSELLAQLSTPLIPVSDGVLAMPLIGPMDAVRAALVMETLLQGISRARARVAILDVTGVREVDGQVAEALVRIARAARLLGAEVVLTGVRPQMARALVELGADLGGIVTALSLESGIAYAAGRR